MKSESIGALAKALAAAQLEIRGAEKDSKNPFFKSTYADLHSVWEACHYALNNCGLSVTQVCDTRDSSGEIKKTFTQNSGERAEISDTPDPKVVLITILMHESGEYISSTYPVIPIKKDPQGLGSALTYARRYSLAAICGVCAIEDDDGNAASDRQQQKAQAQIKYDPTNIIHKNGMKTHLNKIIPFDSSKIDVYKEINEQCKDVLLAELHTHVAKLAEKYRGKQCK